jgi:hypothetical protein
MAVLLYAGTSDTTNRLSLARTYTGAPDQATHVTATITTVYAHDLLDLAFTEERLVYSLGMNTSAGPTGIVDLKGRTRLASHPEVTSSPVELDLQRGFLRVRPRIVQYRDRDSFVRAFTKGVKSVQDLWKKAEAYGLTDLVQPVIDEVGDNLEGVLKRLVPLTGLPEQLVVQLLLKVGDAIVDAIFRDAVMVSDSIDFDLQGTSMRQPRFRRGYYVSAFTDENLTHPERDNIDLAPRKWRLQAGMLVPPRPHKTLRGYMVFRVD